MIRYRKEPWVWKADYEDAVDKNELVGAESGRRVLSPVQGWSRGDLGIRTGDQNDGRPGTIEEETRGNALVIQHGPELMDIAQAAKAVLSASSTDALKVLRKALEKLPQEMLE